MSFEFVGSAAPVRADIVRLFRREWERLARPGTWWSGPERVAIAARARHARYDEAAPGPVLGKVAEEVTDTVAARPAAVRRAWVAEVADELGYPKYVEIVGVVSRLASVDSFHKGVGADREPLPEPEPGTASHAEEPIARLGPAWVPMVGGSSITQALSLVDAESIAQEDMHGPMYMTYEGMAELDYVGGLSRAQMEVVASRTSVVNECFY